MGAVFMAGYLCIGVAVMYLAGMFISLVAAIIADWWGRAKWPR